MPHPSGMIYVPNPSNPHFIPRWGGGVGINNDSCIIHNYIENEDGSYYGIEMLMRENSKDVFEVYYHYHLIFEPELALFLAEEM